MVASTASAGTQRHHPVLDAIDLLQLDVPAQINGLVHDPGCFRARTCAHPGVTELPARPGPEWATSPSSTRGRAGPLHPEQRCAASRCSTTSTASSSTSRDRDRAWNRGQQQENNKELKEAYVDVEVLDSRLWMRLGLQNIVWGKTELFRTTRPVQPAGPRALVAARASRSRASRSGRRAASTRSTTSARSRTCALEFAFNFDQYQPSDLGACGEPYTPDVVCG